jgi:hypothetical protein
VLDVSVELELEDDDEPDEGLPLLSVDDFFA